MTAKNADGSTKGLSNATQEIAGSPQGALGNGPPTITGSAVVGQTLTADPGTWKGTQPISFSYAWETLHRRSPRAVSNGGHGKTYTVAELRRGPADPRQGRTGRTPSARTRHTRFATDTVKKSGGGAPGTAIPVADVGPAGERLVVDQVHVHPEPGQLAEPADHRADHGSRTRRASSSRRARLIQSTPVVASIPTPAADR